MVSEKITKKLIDKICRDLQFYDENGFLPTEKVRLNITISKGAVFKIGDRNKSKFIEEKILS